jgi:hypothetical protein
MLVCTAYGTPLTTFFQKTYHTRSVAINLGPLMRKAQSQYLRVYMTHLRKKIEPGVADERPLCTEAESVTSGGTHQA